LGVAYVTKVVGVFVRFSCAASAGIIVLILGSGIFSLLEKWKRLQDVYCVLAWCVEKNRLTTDHLQPAATASAVSRGVVLPLPVAYSCDHW
jgi:hypothetical protein